MKAKVYNMEGNIVGEAELPANVFSDKVSSELVHDVFLAARANSRVAIAHTKTRGEVRGGGKKPWKQKGTGRARHGSIRSPIWIGGGVVGGPRSDRNFSVKVNRKLKRKALCMALGDKANNNSVFVLESLELPEVKTKVMAKMLKKLPLGKKVLVILPSSNESVLRASRNIPNAKVITANSLSLIDVLTFSSLLLPQPTLKKLDEVFGK